ncbi:hypothetical protein K2173_002594 [Erythroxylum novogranatense]|uniref:Uncharacterized protein n=1 Tax=Erythroxylum novogranatense TaxID=1862640 RepID=A0AAV8TR11_9ROSI|nr:hypothetical protein K2173_002594 [Erythroxylum novogranatense]
MEEVWKDINLSSLHDHPYVENVLSATPRPHNNPHHNPNFLLQDFLARPSDKDPPILLELGPGFEFLDSSRPLRHGLHLQSHHPISNINSGFKNKNPNFSCHNSLLFSRAILFFMKTTTKNSKIKRNQTPPKFFIWLILSFENVKNDSSEPYNTYTAPQSKITYVRYL